MEVNGKKSKIRIISKSLLRSADDYQGCLEESELLIQVYFRKKERNCLYKFIRPTFTLALCVFGLFMDLSRVVEGHGRLIEPPSRSSMWRYGFSTPPNYNDHELYCGGFSRQWKVNKGKCGICGDAWNSKKPRLNEAGGRYGRGVIARRYIPGENIKVQVQLTANHRGHFEFRICPNNNVKRVATQKCLDQHPLTLSDDPQETKYYPGPGSKIFDMMYTLPSHLTCTQCVFQWRYIAGNNWGTCSNGSQGVGCGPQEEFRGCADISILPESYEEDTSYNLTTISTTTSAYDYDDEYNEIDTIGNEEFDVHTSTTEKQLTTTLIVLLAIILCLLIILCFALQKYHFEPYENAKIEAKKSVDGMMQSSVCMSVANVMSECKHQLMSFWKLHRVNVELPIFKSNQFKKHCNSLHDQIHSSYNHVYTKSTSFMRNHTKIGQNLPKTVKSMSIWTTKSSCSNNNNNAKVEVKRKAPDIPSNSKDGKPHKLATVRQASIRDVKRSGIQRPTVPPPVVPQFAVQSTVRAGDVTHQYDDEFNDDDSLVMYANGVWSCMMGNNDSNGQLQHSESGMTSSSSSSMHSSTAQSSTDASTENLTEVVDLNKKDDTAIHGGGNQGLRRATVVMADISFTTSSEEEDSSGPYTIGSSGIDGTSSSSSYSISSSGGDPSAKWEQKTDC